MTIWPTFTSQRWGPWPRWPPPPCGRSVKVAVGAATNQPVRYITVAVNASTTKLKGKQLCASCVIKMAGESKIKNEID